MMRGHQFSGEPTASAIR